MTKELSLREEEMLIWINRIERPLRELKALISMTDEEFKKKYPSSRWDSSHNPIISEQRECFINNE